MGKQTVIGNINLGGISDSEFQGAENSVFRTSCLDIHSEPGIIKANQALKKVGNTTALGIATIACSDGQIYTFCSDGKVSKIDGTVTEVADIASPVLDAIEFDGYIYYATASNLGRVAVPSTGTVDWSAKVNAWDAFTNDNPNYHPMWHQNMILYIGDGNLVAQVDATTGTHVFSADALDLRKEYIITTLGQSGNDLLIGATIKGRVARSEVFAWNTWSVSFSTSDPVPESSINSILAVDNFVIVQAGEKGNIYSYNGSTLDRIKRMQGDWAHDKGALVKKNANTNFFGIPLFGISNNNGNPMKQGIMSYGSWSSGYPNVLNHEYLISEGTDEDVKIGSVLALKDTLIVTWQSGDIFGVDEIDWTQKAPISYFETRKIQMLRVDETISGFKIPWRKLPLGTDIKLFAIENETIERELELTHDKKRQVSFTKTAITECTTLRMRVELHSNENNAPEVEFLLPITK